MQVTAQDREAKTKSEEMLAGRRERGKKVEKLYNATKLLNFPVTFMNLPLPCMSSFRSVIR